MPTIDDLHAAFADLEDRAPHPDDAAPLLAVRRKRRVHHAGALLSAAAVAALAVGVTVVVTGGGADSTSAAAPGTPSASSTPAPTTFVRTTIPNLHESPTAQTTNPLPTRPRSTRIPFMITGIPGLKVHDDLTVTAGSVTWDFGWDMHELSPDDKPDTSIVRFDGREWVVDREQTTGAIRSLWITQPGFGMTITPVEKNLTLDQYKTFLAHVSFPRNLTDPSTWPTAAQLGG